MIPLVYVMFNFGFNLQFGSVKLPSEAFASTYEQDEGLLNLAAPTSGNKNIFTLFFATTHRV